MRLRFVATELREADSAMRGLLEKQDFRVLLSGTALGFAWVISIAAFFFGNFPLRIEFQVGGASVYFFWKLLLEFLLLSAAVACFRLYAKWAPKENISETKTESIRPATVALLVVFLAIPSPIILSSMPGMKHLQVHYANREKLFKRDLLARSIPIRDALEAYRTDHDSYPETLDALLPEYLKALPPSEYGAKRWGLLNYGDRYHLILLRYKSHDRAGYHITSEGAVYYDSGYVHF